MSSRQRRWALVGLALAIFWPAISNAERLQLKAMALSAGQVPTSPLPMEVFRPNEALPARHKFPGHLSLRPDPGRVGIEILVDFRNRAGEPGNRLAELPDISIDLVQSGKSLVPMQRSLVDDAHPYWAYLLGIGQVWNEPGDGDWSRAALPFALQERNQNCTHNGVLSFLYRSDGTVSSAYYQISSETCRYFQADFWGMLDASTSSTRQAASDAITSWRMEQARALPVRPLSALSDAFPAVDINAFVPPSPESTTVYGLVVNGVHYRAGCGTRQGEYPYCDQLHLPSYSTAKSVYAGLGVMRMARLWPEFPSQSIAGLVPQCQLPDGRWDQVTVDNALDMTTGNYDSASYMNDEDSRVWEFLEPDTHEQKVTVACESFQNRSAPGTQWVYHTSDTYLVASAMDAWLTDRAGPNADSYFDTIVKDLWQPLLLSPATYDSLRTFDSVRQATGGLGLTFLPDDIARVAEFIGSNEASGLLAPEALDQALFRGAGATAEHKATALFAYSNGFWGAPGHAWAGCTNLTWIPHMSGFGGITVAMFPNGMVYYVFADSGQFQWSNAAAEINRMESYCS